MKAEATLWALDFWALAASITDRAVIGPHNHSELDSFWHNFCNAQLVKQGWGLQELQRYTQVCPDFTHLKTDSSAFIWIWIPFVYTLNLHSVLIFFSDTTTTASFSRNANILRAMHTTPCLMSYIFPSSPEHRRHDLSRIYNNDKNSQH